MQKDLGLDGSGSTIPAPWQRSVATQQAFNVYRGDKMSHTPVTLFRAAPGKPWLRFDGFVAADDLLHAYQQSVACN